MSACDHLRPVASPWVLRFVHLLPDALPVLDVACGFGRHARMIAAMGREVIGIDRDREALASLAADARVHTVCADIEQGPWPFLARMFGAVIVTNYLHRPLFPTLRSALAPGGVLLYETFAAGNERFGRPSNPDFLLRPGELLRAADGLRILAYEDCFVDQPKPALVQRVCAVAAAEVPVVPLESEAGGGFG